VAELEPRSGIALLADAHIGGPGGSAGALVEQLDRLTASGARRLVILGDLFQVWVADERYETDDVRAVLAAIGRLRGAGIGVDYIEGNRDFFVAGSAYAEVFDSVGTEVAVEAAGLRYLMVHGDGLNEGDRQYLLWRWLSKSRLVRWLMLHLPRMLARRLVHRTERRLAGTNFKHKQRLPEAAICAYGERRLAEGFDRLLLGHFHEPRRWQVAGGEIHLLDAWFNSRALEWL
jgi:UDP-2,3-diacylglucosamine pyrophosphatase LpxH